MLLQLVRWLAQDRSVGQALHKAYVEVDQRFEKQVLAASNNSANASSNHGGAGAASNGTGAVAGGSESSRLRAAETADASTCRYLYVHLHMP